MPKPSKPSSPDDDLRPEYDFSHAEVGKYAKRHAQGTNLVKLDPDVAKDFPTAEAVNDALRKFRDTTKKHAG
jgi:hypothetical protein